MFMPQVLLFHYLLYFDTTHIDLQFSQLGMTTSETSLRLLSHSGKYFRVGRNKSSCRYSGDVNYYGIKKVENDRTWFVTGSGSKRVKLIIYRADIQSASCLRSPRKWP